MAALRDAARPFLAMGGRDAFDVAQSRWLRHRRHCGSDLACIKREYRLRIRVINAVLKRAYSLGPL